MGSPGSASADSAPLTPFVSRVVLEWALARTAERVREFEGSMAFVDLSGFTSMSERLAAKGKAGAEEVSDVMNHTFASLLELAYAEGGSLLKFGGDALLLFFTGTSHETRAARASFRMRKALRDIGRPQTSAGRVTLRMHVGIHSGTFQFFLVGGAHRELIVTGPAATQTVEMESASQAGEILLSAAAAAALPERLLGEARDGGRLLRAEPAGEGQLEPLPDVTGVDLASFVPAMVRDHLIATRLESEHRQATVAFLHFGGTDALIQDRGAEAAAEALHVLVETVQDAAAAHGICFLETDIDRDGGKIVLVAGAPQTTGADEERMLRALRSVVESGPPLPLRIGVNRGRVFAGQVGASFRRTYTILGETAALAARLMSRAGPGEILASTEVVERSATAFETRTLEPFQVKGKTKPVTAAAVGPVAGARVAEPQVRLPLVGRERELAVVTAALTPVRMGFGSLVELVGDPGMGKSRLVEEIVAQAGDLRVLTSACGQYEATTPYYAFRGLLRALVDVPLGDDPAANTRNLASWLETVDPELLPWLPLLAIPLDAEVEPTPEVEELQPAFRRARLHGVTEMLLTALLPSPTLVVLEDVHWMDEASSELLRHLAGQVAGKPWLLCATRRATGAGFVAAQGTPPVPALTLRLEPLADAAAAALVAAAAPDGMLEHDVSAITARGGGNPLFLQALAGTARDARVDEELPESVQAVVATRIDDLPPGDRALLRYAAVMGASFSADLVGYVLADDDEASADSDAWERLAEFVERDPYTPAGFRFRHALFRDAAYEGLSYKRRRELHGRVAELYERTYGDQAAEHAEILSLHFLRAEQHAKAWAYSVIAGDRARAKFANVEAATFYERALDAASRRREADGREVARVREALGDVCELAARYDAAADAYRKARVAARDDVVARAELLRKEGVVRERLGRYGDALRSYGRGLRALENVEPRAAAGTRAALEVSYAGVRQRQGRFADTVEWALRGAENAELADDRRTLAQAYNLLDIAHTRLGTPKPEYRALALPIYEEIGDLVGQASVLNNLGVDAYFEGRWDEAIGFYRRSGDVSRRAGDIVNAARAANNEAEVLSDQGKLDEAEPLLVEAADIWRAAGYPAGIAFGDSNLGRLAARRGRFEEARDLLDQALAAFQELGASQFVVETNARRAECRVFEGRTDEALEIASTALLDAERAGLSPVFLAFLQRLRGYALVQAGRRAEGIAALEESLALARRGAGYEEALTLRALADVGVPDASSLGAHGDALLARFGVVATPRVPLP